VFDHFVRLRLKPESGLDEGIVIKDFPFFRKFSNFCPHIFWCILRIHNVLFSPKYFSHCLYLSLFYASLQATHGGGYYLFTLSRYPVPSTCFASYEHWTYFDEILGT